MSDNIVDVYKAGLSNMTPYLVTVCFTLSDALCKIFPRCVRMIVSEMRNEPTTTQEER